MAPLYASKMRLVTTFHIHSPTWSGPTDGIVGAGVGAAVVRRMSGDASEKSDVTSESIPPNATNTPGWLIVDWLL